MKGKQMNDEVRKTIQVLLWDLAAKGLVDEGIYLSADGTVIEDLESAQFEVLLAALSTGNPIFFRKRRHTSESEWIKDTEFWALITDDTGKVIRKREQSLLSNLNESYIDLTHQEVEDLLRMIDADFTITLDFIEA